MRVHELHAFPQDNGTKIRQKCKEVRESCGRRNCREGYVVHLQAREEPSNTDTVWRVTMRDDYHL